MKRLLPTLIASVGMASLSDADPEKVVATVDKTGTFHGLGTISDPRPEPASNGDLQRVRWDAHEGYERLVLDLHEIEYGAKKTPPLKTPGYYRITNEIFPCRIVCDLNGRQMNGLIPPPDFEGSRLISGVHRIVVLDDASVKFALELREQVEIEVFELHDPARIVIDLRPARGAATRFSVRTPGVGGGEKVGSLEETLFLAGFKNTRALRCADGSFCIEAGLFSTSEEAAGLAGRIAAKGIPVMIEERGINDLPKAP